MLNQEEINRLSDLLLSPSLQTLRETLIALRKLSNDELKSFLAELLLIWQFTDVVYTYKEGKDLIKDVFRCHKLTKNAFRLLRRFNDKAFLQDMNKSFKILTIASRYDNFPSENEQKQKERYKKYFALFEQNYQIFMPTLSKADAYIGRVFYSLSLQHILYPYPKVSNFVIQILLDYQPDNITLLKYMADNSTDNPNKAKLYYKKCVALGTDDPLVYHSLGEIYRDKEQDFAQALPMFEKAYNLAPDNGSFCTDIALTYIMSSQHNKGIHYLQQAAKLKDAPFIVFSMLAVYYAGSGIDRQKSIDFCLEQLQIITDYRKYTLHAILGEEYMALSNFDEAHYHLEKATEGPTFMNDSVFINYVDFLLRDEQQKEKAIAILEKRMDYHPSAKISKKIRAIKDGNINNSDDDDDDDDMLWGGGAAPMED